MVVCDSRERKSRDGGGRKTLGEKKRQIVSKGGEEGSEGENKKKGGQKRATDFRGLVPH